MHQSSRSIFNPPLKQLEAEQQAYSDKPNRVSWLNLAQALIDINQPDRINELWLALGQSTIDRLDADSIVEFCLRHDCLQSNLAALEKLTKQHPQVERLWMLLEMGYTGLKQPERAQAAQRQYEMVSHFNHQLTLAADALSNDRLRDADQIIRGLLNKVPGELRAMHLMSLVAYRLEQFDAARQILYICCQSQPHNSLFIKDYIKTLLACGNNDEVITQSDQYSRQFGINAHIQSYKGAALVKLARYAEARDCYQQLVVDNPDNGLALLRYGNVLKIIGDTEPSIEAYKKALVIDPSCAAEGYWNLANLKSYRFTTDDINAMTRLAEQISLPLKQRTFIHFALGKAYEDEQQYEKSFEHYTQANRLFKQKKGDPQPLDIDRIKEAFSSTIINSLTGRGHPSDEPIFIVGMPRSGSTLVEQILASHPDVDGTMELYEIPAIAKSLREDAKRARKSFSEYLSELNKADIHRLAQRYLDFIQPLRRGGKFVIDKLPANFEHIGLIKILFPNARIIDVKRDKMAVCWAIYKQFFAQGYQYAYAWDDIANHHNQYHSLMNHWQALFPQQIFTLHYEQLINQFEQTVSELLNYCGLPASQACIDFHQNTRAVATPSAEQVRQPIYQHGLNNWQHFSQFLQPLEQALQNK